MSRFRNSWFVVVFPVMLALLFGLCMAIVHGEEVAVDGADDSTTNNASYLQDPMNPSLEDGGGESENGRVVTALEVAPTEIALDGPFDYAQLVLTAVLENGERIDVTRFAESTAVNEIVELSEDRLVRATSDGNGPLKFRFGGHEATVEFIVTNTNSPPPVEFITDVMPIFARAGCNAGTCHGAQKGQNGFKLSLRGYDPLADHRAFTDDHASRRTNRAAPEQSLMLLKSTGQVPHVGLVAIELDSPYYKTIRKWIAEGTRFRQDAPRATSIDIWPKNPIVPRPGMQQQFRVVATYAGGETRDVTREAFLESGDTETATSDRSGRLTALRRGEAPVLARYEGSYAVTMLTVMGDREGFEWADSPAFNFVDELVYEKLKRLKVGPGELSTDAEFIRRVHLDLTGLPPTTAETRAFLDDERETRVKRDALIDTLIGSPEYIEEKTNKWADLLQVNGKFLGREGATAFRAWIRKHVESNTPYDEFARQIVTATGSNRENPAASYFKILRDPDAIMENTTHLFLGVRFNCNKCHDHPFERWTQDQYYETAAFFAQTGLKKDPESGDRTIGGTAVEGAKPFYEEVFDKTDGEVTHIRTGTVSAPEFPYEHDYDSPDDATRRQRLAAWITSSNNRYFAKSFVNRQWAYLMGVGFIEPIDDIRAGNPPSNPALLDRLTQAFIDSHFDTQELVRTICKSRTYQLSISANRWNEDDHRNYSHATARRLPAEVLLDSVYRVTGSASKFPGLPPGTRAAQLPDVGIKLPGGFLDDLGRPPRESACECERTNSLMLGPIMKLVNGPTLADAIIDPQNAITKLESEIKSDAALVQELFLRILNRWPSADELSTGVETLAHGVDDVQRAQAAFAERQELVDSQFDGWLTGQRVLRWHTLGRIEAASTNGAALIPQPDYSILAQGPEGKTAYTIIAYTDLPEISGLRIEALTDDSLPNKGPGRAGSFVLSELRVTAAPLGDPAAAKAVTLKDPRATFNQNGLSVDKAIDGKAETGWAIHPQYGRNHSAVFTFSEPVAFDGGTRLVIVLDHQHPDGKHALGRFRLSVTSAEGTIEIDRHPENIMAILRTRTDRRSDEQKNALVVFHRQLDAQFVDRQKAAQRLTNARLVGTQDLTWALINSPAFLFNR